MNISVRYSTIDGFTSRRSFKTLAGARKFAQEWVGKNPDQGCGYAVAFDGVGKITVSGTSLASLFGDVPPPPPAPLPSPVGRLRIKSVHVDRQGCGQVSYRGCDGYPAARAFPSLGVVTEDGREWVMPNGRRVVDEDGFEGALPTYDADLVQDRIERVGSIDPQYWVHVEPIDLEAEWAAEWEREQMER